MTLNINKAFPKESHLLDAENMARAIWNKSPIQQQEMKDHINDKLVEWTTEHLQILKK